MEDAGKLLVALGMLAFLVQWIQERFFGKWIHGDPAIWLSAALGVGAALLFQVDGLALAGLPEPLLSPWSGQVITGIIVGAGSNVVNDFFTKKPVQPPVPPPAG